MTGRIFYSVRETAEVLSLGRSTIYNLMQDHKLKSVRIGNRRLIYVDSVHKFAGLT